MVLVALEPLGKDTQAVAVTDRQVGQAVEQVLLEATTAELAELD